GYGVVGSSSDGLEALEGEPAFNLTLGQLPGIKDLVAGLDYAFPNAPKIGAVLSTGTRSKSRAMFAWSANAPAAAKRRGTSASSSAAARLRA
ncbi:uncharacterized protein HaLaN_26368, partial [Haematococcus lacustris]